MDFDDYEMKEREQEQEREQERAREELEEANQEEETNFDDIEDVIVDIGNHEDQLENLDLDGIPNVGKDVANIKRSITSDVKKIFRDIFDVSIEKKNGKNSIDILENTKFLSSKSGRISIEFKGSRIGWVERNKDVNLFEKKNKRIVKEFRDSMELVKLEYEKSPSSLVRDLPEEVVDSVLN